MDTQRLGIAGGKQQHYARKCKQAKKGFGLRSHFFFVFSISATKVISFFQTSKKWAMYFIFLHAPARFAQISAKKRPVLKKNRRIGGTFLQMLYLCGLKIYNPLS
jgi:hypothetical protein